MSQFSAVGREGGRRREREGGRDAGEIERGRAGEREGGKGEGE